MSTHPHPRLEGPTNAPDGASSAGLAPTPAGGGAPRVVARQGVPSALRPDPHATVPLWHALADRRNAA